ncbi:MarR family transcriptional regulator [Paucilactobacillus oligofermentans DSM 15707 = LMG 22743]|uniref:MarR family transcriptional regulator n=1 Tax=Paucilactobacillus oligofermentans DSM 15707 = LMG 22743 TaxID=1423778 RepID=A0A0R1RJQ8_9LACO|nr:MarR family winged helix-turn-helix transcriptional regulator [Paucilactobacillus oligofermentans]KRL55476.1 MarR family transcriptional regulator [Paucilactobacillus oligofermentans DSM 15707 = LMG 22743]CUS25539.1 MarR family transcriptional regulator [Paucilactobacillus oligofermentans DSM 15707 = LMG 22743]
MSFVSDDLMKQLSFIGSASSAFMSQQQQTLTGQDRVLAVLAKENNLTQSYLAEILDLRPSSLAELLKKMENSGDIIRIEDDQDKRVKHIQLTTQGKSKTSKLASSKKSNASDTFLTGLDDQQQVELRDALGKIIAGWSPEFRAHSSRYIDPMDRLQAMQQMREEWLEKGGIDRKMSRHDLQVIFEKRFEEFHQNNHDLDKWNPWSRFKD